MRQTRAAPTGRGTAGAFRRSMPSCLVEEPPLGKLPGLVPPKVKVPGDRTAPWLLGLPNEHAPHEEASHNGNGADDPIHSIR